MTYNDVLRSVRYMLNLSEDQMINIIAGGGGKITPSDMESFLKKEEEPGYVKCPAKVMDQFLNGLIYLKRGKDDSRPPMPAEVPNNNSMLKKLRVAFNLKDDDILALFQKSGAKITKTEISALFRKAGHDNYRVCQDQFLRYFLKGLTEKVRS